MQNNRQLRSWVFMLYPDNEKHQKAINYIDLLDNSLYIKHVAKFDGDGNQINKEHYHCILRYDSGTWLSTLLSNLGLSDEDAHLFHSFKDFKDKKGQPKYKTLEDYGNYLDHVETDKPDKYSIDDFHGGLKEWIKNIINKRENNSIDNFVELVNFIREFNLENIWETRHWGFKDWFLQCVKSGYATTFWNNWYKMRDILKDYINY